MFMNGKSCLIPLMAIGCALCTGNLPKGGLHRNSVDRITDRPDMTTTIYRGRKASTQPTNQITPNDRNQFKVMYA